MTEIKREHIEYREQRWMRHMYRDLYKGGHHFKIRAGEYLLRRQKEPLDVYSERLNRVFYQNYIGSIIDWYGATLFRRKASLHTEGGLQSGRDFLEHLQTIATCGAPICRASSGIHSSMR